MQGAGVTADEIAALFTRADGQYLFARWGRPVVPVVFGVDDATLQAVKAALEAVVTLADHKIEGADPELGANLMIFFVRDWAELPAVPNLDRMIEGLAALCDRLARAGANQYRIFRFDARGAIMAAFVFVRLDVHLAAVSAETLALSQAVQVILLWSDRAFVGVSPLVQVGDTVMLRPEIARVIRAGYLSVLPDVAQDASHALRLAARVGAVM